MPYLYSNEFVQASFKGYSKELDEKYGFNAALEWYLDSNADAAIETNFLDASTCLELLIDNLLSEEKMDLILTDEDFKLFYKEICKSADSILRNLDKDDKTIDAIKSSLKQAQRTSFVNKIRLLINYWGIRIEDTKIRVQDIRDVRNEITHTGRFQINNDADIKNLIRVNNGLQTLLTRIFLAMLKYDRSYLDYGVQHNSNGESSEWINFKEVCSKIGKPRFDSE